LHEPRTIPVPALEVPTASKSSMHNQDGRCVKQHMQVEESTPFAPIARKEIGALAWHVVNELPMTKEQSAMVCVIVSCLPTARYSNSLTI